MSSPPFEFLVRDGPEKGQRLSLPEGRFAIGSKDGCALRFPANYVRDVHAEVYRDDEGTFTVEDKTGASLVWVDGKVVTRAPLYSGTVLRLGRLELLFVSLEDTAAAEPSMTEQPTGNQEPGGSTLRQPTPFSFASNPPIEHALAALRATPLGRSPQQSAVAPGAPGPVESSGPTPSGRFNAGDVIEGRYRIVSRIAAGGMGEVFKVEHVELGKALAMKVMLPGLNADQEFVNRFKIEAVAASRIGHPNIIDISDFGKTQDGRFFFVMEFLDGMTLSSLVHRQGQQSPARAVSLILQVSRALAAAHELHIVHRDLKPENVMVLQRPGNPDLVKVLDFGVARVEVDHESIGKTAAGIVVGTPQYMSPEQAKAVPVDTRSDIYSLGLILHELLTGKPCFTGETPPIVMVKQVTEAPPPLPEWVPEELQELVFRMLEKNPGDRPQEMKEVVEVLDRLHRTLKTSDFQVPRQASAGPERSTHTPAPQSGRRATRTPTRAPTPTRSPTPTRNTPNRSSPSGTRAAPLTIEPAPAPQPEAPSVAEDDAALDVPPPSSKLPLALGAVLVLALVGGLVVLLGDFSGAAVTQTVKVIEPIPEEPVRPKEPPPPVVTEVPVRIESVPEGAEVQEAGVVLGNTPYTLKRKPGDIVDLTLSLAGFQTAERKVKVSADVASVSVKLEAVKVVKRPDPKPDKPDPKLEPRPDVKPDVKKPDLKQDPFGETKPPEKKSDLKPLTF
ncbi:MAG: protein kinase [Myxococcaceae bacterium]|nr:protein kinase [Myxococcaceae bacterium]